MSSSPCNCRARRRSIAPPMWSARSNGSRWIRRASCALRHLPASRERHATQAGNAAALFPVFDEPEVRLKKGLTATAITAELRKRLASIQSAFIIVIPPPAVPGIGTGGGFAMRIQDRQGRGAANAVGGDRRACRRRAQGAAPDLDVLALHREHAAGLRRHRPRQGAETRRADRQHQRNDPDLFRLHLRQRLQPVWPHLPRHRAGRPAVPERERRSRAGCARAMPAATW